MAQTKIQFQLIFRNEIEFVAWGLKKGQSIFFHSEGMDPSEVEVENTLEDIRKMFSYESTGIYLYSYESTSKHKVYTI